MLLLQPLHGLSDVPHHSQGTCALVLGNADRQGFFAIITADAVRLLLGPLHVGHVRQMNQAAGSGKQRNLPQILYSGHIRRADGADGLRTLLQGADGNCKICGRDILGDAAHSQSILIHGLLVQLHLNIILPSATDLYAGHRAYRLQLRHNLIIGQGENVAAVGGA